MQVHKGTEGPPDAYRGVNKYVNFTTGDYYLSYTKVYKSKGSATAQANLSARKDYYNTNSPKGTMHLTVNGVVEKFEWVEQWTEVAEDWKRV